MPKPLKAAVQWALEWGPHAEFLDARADRADKIPEALLNRPDLPEYLERALTLFFTLSPSRPLGFGCCSGIATADIVAVWPESGLDKLDWLHLCRAMDTVYLEYVHKTANRPKPKT